MSDKIFRSQAHTWWDARGPFALLHRMNPLRLRFIRDTMGGTIENASVLDIGCGGGILCEPLARQGARVVGLDSSPEAIRVARQHAHDLVIDYRLGEVSDLTESFDIVTALEIIEHVADPAFFMKHVCARIKPGGWLFVSTINRTWSSYFLGILAAEYVLRWVPRGTHRWEDFSPPHKIDSLMRSEDVHVQEIRGLSYHPFQKEWRFSSDLSTNYILSAQKRFSDPLTLGL